MAVIFRQTEKGKKKLRTEKRKEKNAKDLREKKKHGMCFSHAH